MLSLQKFLKAVKRKQEVVQLKQNDSFYGEDFAKRQQNVIYSKSAVKNTQQNSNSYQKRNSPLDKIPQIEMEKSVDVESVTQNFIGQTDTPTNTVSDYMKQENLYSLKNQPIPYKQRLLIQLLQTQAAQKQSVVNFGFNTILIA